jgi:hypothetical protein
MIQLSKNLLDEYQRNVHRLLYEFREYGLMNLSMHRVFNIILELLSDVLFYYDFGILMVLNIMNFMECPAMYTTKF